MAIYTKTGDKGTTSTLFGKRISKDSLLIEAIGTIDEANSVWGIARTHCKNKKTQILVEKVQADLFTIGSILAGNKTVFPLSKVKYVEAEIDSLESKLPVLSNFILPGGSSSSSHFHLARSVTRRAERRLVRLKRINPTIILKYINRLSDLAFMLARDQNHSKKIKELTWNQ